MAKKAEIKKLTFADLTTKPAGELAPFLVDTVKIFGTINTAKEKFTGMLQFSAKVVAAFERLYTERLHRQDIPANTPFKEYLKQNAGGEVPGRVLALANLFNTLVLTLDANGKPLLPEEFFDAAKVDWLEKANAIITAARKMHGENWKGCDDVLDVINALSKPGDAAKVLKEIRKRQTGKDTESANDGEAPVLTIGRCVEFLIATIKNAAKMPESEAAELFGDVVRLTDAWEESGISDDKLNEWSRKLSNGVAPQIEVVTAPAAGTAPAETPENETDETLAIEQQEPQQVAA